MDKNLNIQKVQGFGAYFNIIKAKTKRKLYNAPKLELLIDQVEFYSDRV